MEDLCNTLSERVKQAKLNDYYQQARDRYDEDLTKIREEFYFGTNFTPIGDKELDEASPNVLAEEIADTKRQIKLLKKLTTKAAEKKDPKQAEKAKAEIEKLEAHAKHAKELYDGLEQRLTTEEKLYTLQDDILSKQDLQKAEILEKLDGLVDGFMDYFLEDPTLTRYIDSVAYKLAPDSPEDVREYVALMYMNKNKNAIRKEMAEYFKYNKNKNNTLAHASGVEGTYTEKAMLKSLEDRMAKRLDKARNEIKAAGYTPADEKDVEAEIKTLMADYDEAKSQPDSIIYHENGQEFVVQTDLFLADLNKYRYVGTGTKPTQRARDAIANHPVTIGLNRLARINQTLLNPGSWINQSWRDPANGRVMAGMRFNMGAISADLEANYKDAILEYFRTNQPADYKWAKEQADAGDGDLFEYAERAIYTRGKVLAERGTATEYYRTPKYSKETELFGSQAYQKTKTGLKNFADKALRFVEKKDQPREAGVRYAVYRSNLHKALQEGKTVEEAIQIATFCMSNATTNYDRMLTHMENLRRTVNYFGAGVNGFKSFWRMFELDPVGVMTRMAEGILVPIIAATVISLINEKDREVYRNIKEYEKDNQLVFVLDGVVYKIPIPQEMNLFTSMTRSAVESMFDGNRHSFWDLAMNNLLGMGPVDFSDILDIDANRFSEDAGFWERLGGLGLSLINQTQPTFVVAAFELATGIDTYTGKPIDTSYYLYDDEGNRFPVGGTNSSFAQGLAKITGKSPAVIAHTLKTFFGQVGTNIIDAVTSGDYLGLVEDAITDLAPIRISNYDRAASEWNSQISALWREKEALLEVYRDYDDQISKESDPNKKEALRTKRQDLVDPFLKKVATAVSKLKEEYPGEYDRYRFASVVSLLTFSTGVTNGDTAEQREQSKQIFYANRDKAYEWMSSLGIGASDDQSILGYYTVNANGDPVVKYNTPVEILAAREALYGSADRNVAELKVLLSDRSSDLKELQQEARDYRTKVYNGSGTYAEKSKLISAKVKAYNAEVAKEIAPYIEKMTPEAVLGSNTVINYLREWFLVPPDFEVNNNGKATSSLGDNGSKTDAYIKSYIQKYFGANL